MKEAGPAVVSGPVWTAEEGRSHADAVVPAERMQPDVAGVERVVQVVPPFRVFVHVAAEDLSKRSASESDAHLSSGTAKSTKTADRTKVCAVRESEKKKCRSSQANKAAARTMGAGRAVVVDVVAAREYLRKRRSHTKTSCVRAFERW